MAPDQIFPVPSLYAEKLHILHMPPTLGAAWFCCWEKMLTKAVGMSIPPGVIPTALPVWGQGHNFPQSHIGILLKEASGSLSAQ
jgi:hypothetical protein